MGKKDLNISQPVLFDAEEMGRITPGDIWEEKNKPVICLGMEFPNDDARREHFREELRKKLPELRQIEGFPIGKDEDIIRLSDPPYYTACPNPWLNDFIAEWEKEKKLLEVEGKRKSVFEVKEPYASDVSEGKSNPVYTAHTYHTKVPHPAIMRYILHYTQPGDIILDGFAGTGMTGVAAQACGESNTVYSQKIADEWKSMFKKNPQWGVRHAICGDLSPYAADMSYCYNSPLNVQLFKSEIERIVKELNDECAWMYKTTDDSGKPVGKINCVVWSDVFVCHNCGKEFVFWNESVDNDNMCIHDSFECPHCHAQQTKKTSSVAFETVFDEGLGTTVKRVKSVPVIVAYSIGTKRYEKKPDQYDLDVLRKIDEMVIEDYYPNTRLPEGGETRRNDKIGITNVHQFFTKRNLAVLSRLYSKIDASPIADKLRFVFTGMINRSTVMNRVHINNYFFGGGGWNAGHLKGTLYVPNAPVETSVLEQISDKVSALIRASEFLPKRLDNLQYVGSADNLTIADNTIDYIFVDPPFGANINYSELNFLPEPWLKVITNNQHEAIENSGQDKDADFYRETMVSCFKEFYRVLKPGKWITIEFSNTSSAVWNSIQQAITSAGFVIAYVAALDKKQGGIRSITTTTAVRQDLILSCYKPSEKMLEKFVDSTNSSNVWTFVDEHLRHLPVHLIEGESTSTIVERSPKILYDRLISYYVQHNLPVPMDATEFQIGLRERFLERDGMFFTAAQASEYEEKRKHTNGFAPMGIIVSDEANGIEWLKNLLRDAPKTYQQIQPEWMQAINGLRKGDILPELKALLEENFIEMPDGKWRLPNIQDDKDVNALRTKTLLKEFKIYVDVAQKPKAKIKEARVEALRAGFKQCYVDKDFQTIVTVGDKIPQNLLTEDEVLLQFYDIAQSKL
ncbi:MAG: hypothetical protein IKX61_02235 [Prevotella sp.]|nr:hypothetical protein [Prevotella sp.]